jgi:hypothetical protein
MTTDRELTTEESARYLGISKSCLLRHIRKGHISPVGIRLGVNNHPPNTYAIKDLDALRPLIAYDKRKPVTPTEDEKTEYDSVIHWSLKHRKPSKYSSGATIEYVPITCRCGEKCEVDTYEFRRKGQPRLPLCFRCATYVTRHRGQAHERWISGERIRQDGYREIHVSRLSLEEQILFKGMKTSSNYIMEHRLVMARHLGRPLSRNEHVHHLDKVKLHNDISNLRLVSPQEHAEVELTWAR